MEEAGELKSFGSLPLVVMSNGLGQADLAQLPPNVSKSSFEAMNASWQDMQNQLVSLSSNSVHLVAKHSHHNVQAEEPQAAAEAIAASLDLLQKRASGKKN
jgi:hypothetical protein